ncbi:MAG: VWA domain-containing protein [Planctomycetia bacterium]|nr:VWA domain-containing protein [Planctomycetia bacterium]
MPAPYSLPCLLAAADVRHRVASRLVEGFDEWWQMPAALLAVGAIATLVSWMYRRDAADLHPAMAVALAALRLAAFAALAAALLDFERIAEHEIDLPSRVAVLVDSSASMSLADADDPAASRSRQALDLLETGGLLESLRREHEVSLWRFDADAEPVLRLPRAADAAGAEPAAPTPWQERLAARGYETRLGEAITRVLDAESSAVLAGVILLSDGGHNAGIDPRVAAAAAAAAGVPVHPIGIGADVLPANVRVADLLAPARVFPGDRFAVTGFLQSQGLVDRRVRVELAERSADEKGQGRVLDTVEAALGADGELVPVRFDVPGLATTGRRTLVVRVDPPAGDRTPADDVQVTDVEVVDRVTQVLLMAGGPGREYQFMRNLLERDKSFAVDVLLGTAAAGISQDARRILDAFPASDDLLGEYDAIVAFDYDWRLLDAAAQARLERWVAAESGGLVLSAGPVFMDAWLADQRTAVIRDLYPVELRRPGQVAAVDSAPNAEPRPLTFTREGTEAEFLWLAGSRTASEQVWQEFPGVYSCCSSAGAKPGATVYARVGAAVGNGRESIYLAGQFYGSGIVLAVGSGELWRLRAVEDAAYERLATQLVRHVSQGRLMRGARRGRLIVDRDRFPVGGTVTVRVVAADPALMQRVASFEAIAPDGTRLKVPLAAEPARPGTFQGSFVASREGGWQIEVDTSTGDGEPLSRRIQVQLPDRELANPKLDRGLLSQIAVVGGATPRFLADGGLTAEAVRSLVDSIPDRSRREYETGAADAGFKQTLNSILLAAGCGFLCIEWIVRRLARLA